MDLVGHKVPSRCAWHDSTAYQRKDEEGTNGKEFHGDVSNSTEPRGHLKRGYIAALSGH